MEEHGNLMHHYHHHHHHRADYAVDTPTTLEYIRNYTARYHWWRLVLPHFINYM